MRRDRDETTEQGAETALLPATETKADHVQERDPAHTAAHGTVRESLPDGAVAGRKGAGEGPRENGGKRAAGVPDAANTVDAAGTGGGAADGRAASERVSVDEP
ncbi:hypothetical protein C0036_11635, partial [Streptomyces sp. DJ]